MKTRWPVEQQLRGVDVRDMLPSRPRARAPRGEWVTAIGWTAEAQADDAELLALVAALEEVGEGDDFPALRGARP